MLLSKSGVDAIVDEVVDVSGGVGVVDRLNEMKVLTVRLCVRVIVLGRVV